MTEQDDTQAFTVRLPAELHRDLGFIATALKVSMTSLITDAVERLVKGLARDQRVRDAMSRYERLMGR